MRMHVYMCIQARAHNCCLCPHEWCNCNPARASAKRCVVVLLVTVPCCSLLSTSFLLVLTSIHSFFLSLSLSRSLPIPRPLNDANVNEQHHILPILENPVLDLEKIGVALGAHGCEMIQRRCVPRDAPLSCVCVRVCVCVCVCVCACVCV